MNEAIQTSHLHVHLHKTQRKLDVKRSNLGASQVNYILYSPVHIVQSICVDNNICCIIVIR